MSAKKKDAPQELNKQGEAYIHLTNDVRPHRMQEWLSVYYQLQIPAMLDDVHSVLEFGPGRGLMGAVMRHYGLSYKCADVVDMGSKPDFLSSIKGFKSDETFDLVCAFQTLEHNPPEDFEVHLKKMAQISNKYIYVSLPYYGRWCGFNLNINIPKFRKNLTKILTWPRFKKDARLIAQYRKSKEPYRHHWFEVGDKGFSKSDIKEIVKECGLKVVKDFHVTTYPYHYFILLERDNA